MANWKASSLGELCTRLTVGHVGSMASEYQETGIPFLRSQNIRRGTLDWGNIKFISPHFHENLSKSQLLPGDIVIVRTGEPGAAAVVPEGIGELNCSDLVIARPGPGVDPRFLCYSINTTARQYISAHTVGAVQQHFNVGAARNLNIHTPPLREQQSIAEILGTLDNKIAVNDRISSTTRELCLTLFKKEIEQDFAEVELGELTTTITRGVAPKYSDDKSQLLVLNQKCIRSGRVSLGPARRTLTDKVPAAKLITYGDILVNSTGVGTLGRVAIWHHKKIATVDSHVTIVRFDEEKVDPIIAGFAMFDAQPKIEQLGEGSTGQTELSRLKLNRLKIRIPSQNQDSDLAAKIRTLEAQSDALLLQSKTIAELRDTLLPKLMSGELRVKDAERLVEDAV